MLLKYKWWSLFAVVIAINIGAEWMNVRIDLTDDQRYTLSADTKTMLQNLDSTITIDVLMKGNFPAVFRQLQKNTQYVLDEMREYAGNKMTVRFVKPGDGLSDSAQALLFDSLKAMGIQPYTLQVQRKAGESAEQIVYPAAIIKKGGRAISIDLLSGKTAYTRDPLSGRLQLDEVKSINNAAALLEFKLADAIYKLQQEKKPMVAYLTGNGEPTGPETFDLVQSLAPNYDLNILNPSEVNAIPSSFAAIMVVKPSIPFSDSVRMKLDQYVMQGGKILWFLDMLYAERDSLVFTRQTLAYDRNLNLDDLLFRYGVRIQRDLLQDLQCDMSKLVVGMAGDQPQLADVPFNYYPLLQAQNQHPISKNLEPVLTRFTNTLDTVAAKGIKKFVLLASSENAKTLNTPAIISLEELKTIENPQLYNKTNLPVAVLLEGKFNSLYANRASNEMKTYFTQAYGRFITQSEPNSMLVVADGDMVLNEFSRQEPFSMGYSRVLERSFSNRTFLLNALQYMIGNPALVMLRNKEISLQLLNTETVEAERLYWQMLNIGLPILLIVLAGLAYRFWRNRSYAKPAVKN